MSNTLLKKTNVPKDGGKDGVKVALKKCLNVSELSELIFANPFLSAKAMSQKISEKVKITNRTTESDWA